MAPKDPRKNLRTIRERYAVAIERAVRQACLETERQAKQNLTDLEKVDQGITRNSIDHEVRRTATEVEGVTFAGSLWAPWVEFGRHGTKQSPAGTGPNSADPAWPPVDAIRNWVRRNRVKIGLGRKSKDSEINSVAYLIGRKIHEKGIAPSPYLMPAFLNVSAGFRNRIAKAIRSVKI